MRRGRAIGIALARRHRDGGRRGRLPGPDHHRLAAQISCGGHFVGGRPVADAAAGLPDNPLLPFLRIHVDDDAGTVSASLPD